PCDVCAGRDRPAAASPMVRGLGSRHPHVAHRGVERFDASSATGSRSRRMKPHRLARVREVIREVASETILFEMKDPRVKGVTVTRAEVTADLQHAKVFISIIGTASEQALCLHGLRHAAGLIQKKLADRLQTRYTP